MAVVVVTVALVATKAALRRACRASIMVAVIRMPLAEEGGDRVDLLLLLLLLAVVLVVLGLPLLLPLLLLLLLLRLLLLLLRLLLLLLPLLLPLPLLLLLLWWLPLLLLPPLVLPPLVLLLLLLLLKAWSACLDFCCCSSWSRRNDRPQSAETICGYPGQQPMPGSKLQQAQLLTAADGGSIVFTSVRIHSEGSRACRDWRCT